MKTKIKALLTGLLLAGSSVFAAPFSYQNNIRSTSDRSKSVFRILKSSGAIQSLDGVNLPLNSGVVTDGTGGVLAFENTAASPSLVYESSLPLIRVLDGVAGSVTFRLRVPDGYSSGGNLMIRAKSDSNVTTTTKLSTIVYVNGSSNDLGDTAVSTGSDQVISIDYSSLTVSSGDDLAIEVSRNDATSGTGTLDIKNIFLRFNEDMTNSW